MDHSKRNSAFQLLKVQTRIRSQAYTLRAAGCWTRDSNAWWLMRRAQRRKINHLLRADFWNYQKSGVSREISNSFIFCPYNLYSGVFSKITLKVSSACYFFRNRAKFEIRQISVLSVTKLTKNYPFSSLSYKETRCPPLMKCLQNINTSLFFIMH